MFPNLLFPYLFAAPCDIFLDKIEISISIRFFTSPDQPPLSQIPYNDQGEKTQLTYNPNTLSLHRSPLGIISPFILAVSLLILLYHSHHIRRSLHLVCPEIHQTHPTISTSPTYTSLSNLLISTSTFHNHGSIKLQNGCITRR